VAVCSSHQARRQAERQPGRRARAQQQARNGLNPSACLLANARSAAHRHWCNRSPARQQRRRHRTSPPSRAPRAPPPPSCRTRPAAPVWHAVTQADAAPANFYFFSRTAPAWKALIQDLGLSATTPGWQQSWQQQCSGRHGTGAWHPGVQQNLGSACARARTSRRSLYWLSGVAISSSLGAANISRPSSSERIRPSLPRSARAGVARGHAPKTERCGSERLTAWGLVGQAPQ